MNKKIAYIIKTSIDNLIVAIAMSITASMLSSCWNYMTWVTIIFSFAISSLLCVIIPSGKICAWFGGLFHLKANTLPCDLVGGLFTNIYITAILSFSCKTLIYFGDMSQALPVFLKTYWVMYLVSYVIYEISFYLTNKLYLKMIKD
jgi:hypothetical protein